MSTNIDGGSGLEPITIRAARSKHSAVNHSATPARPQTLKQQFFHTFHLMNSLNMSFTKLLLGHAFEQVLPFECNQNKKVLLRERKRHTNRSASSTPSTVRYPGRGVPIPAGGIPHLGYPPSRPGWGVGYPTLGTPHPDLARVPPRLDPAGVPPPPSPPPVGTWLGYPPHQTWFFLGGGGRNIHSPLWPQFFLSKVTMKQMFYCIQSQSQPLHGQLSLLIQ